jgi:hypothetical protein
MQGQVWTNMPVVTQSHDICGTCNNGRDRCTTLGLEVLDLTTVLVRRHRQRTPIMITVNAPSTGTLQSRLLSSLPGCRKIQSLHLLVARL